MGFAAVFAVIGWLLLLAAHAATGDNQPADISPQLGAICGNASKISDSSAIGGSAVQFGVGSTPCAAAASTMPTNLQVFTGGDNIALVWDMPADPVQGVQVWRDGTQIATVTPSSGVSIQNLQIGKEYDDNAVTAGSTYQYKLRAVLAGGATSDFTPAVSVTQPKDSMPVPTITVNTAGASTALANYMQTYIVPLLKTWYPKDANELAYPAYTPPASLSISFTLSDGNYCETYSSGSTGMINCDPNQVAGAMTQPNNDVAAAFVHESTHAIQNNASGPSWVIEGGASWASDFFARQNINNFIPHPGDQLGGYTPGAWFIEFMRENYSANFPRDVNIAAHSQTYSDGIIAKDTGGRLTTAAQAWQTAIDAYNSTTGAITGTGGKCVEVENGTVGYGSKVVLDDCGTNSSRLVTNAKFTSGVGTNVCLDDNASSGTKADSWTCVDGATNETWAVLGNGEVLSEASHACLTNQGGVNEAGNPVILSACTGGPSQLWQVGGNFIKNIAAGLCVTNPNPSAYGIETTVNACTGAADQTWRPSGQTTVNGDLAQQWALTFHSIAKTGKFEITSPTLGNPTGTDWCMDVSGSGTADGTIVQYWGCNQSSAQFWQLGSNGTVVNINSGKCLSTTGGSSGNGTGLVIRTCDGGADQKWTTPAAS